MPDSPTGAYVAKRLLFNGRQQGRVAHLIVVAMPAGAAPGPGVGWRTLCGKRWADGARTGGSYGWGFGRQGDALLCRQCERASLARGDSGKGGEHG
jgi:hypothetical protein